MIQAVIVEGVRSAIGKRNGSLKDIHAVDLAAEILTSLINRAGIEPRIVDDVVFGCVSQLGEQGVNIARNAVLAAKFPFTVPATTIDRQCGSSQQAIHFAANLIQSGVCDIVIAGGVESMSRVPMGSNAINPGTPFAPTLMEEYDLVPQGISAQLIAGKYDISRQEMDEYALRSHTLAMLATDKGYLKSQIHPIRVGETVFEVDEGLRRNTSLESLSELKPAFDPSHSITAGNSSQISDGAAALLLMSQDRAMSLGLKIRAKIIAQSVVGCDPVLMLEGPIPATQAVLRKASLTLKDIDLFEVNEAFASVVLAWAKETHAPLEKANVNGGAIAIGHPLGASGARLMLHLLNELERRDLRYGLETMCCGGGLGTATIIDRVI